MDTVYSNIDEHVGSLLVDYKNNLKNKKEISIELEKIYKNEFTSFGNKRVYARYGITKSGKILIDFKRNGRPISLSINECEKLNNILSSRNFENYITSKQTIIDERNNQFFESLNKKREDYNKQKQSSTIDRDIVEKLDLSSLELKESNPLDIIKTDDTLKQLDCSLPVHTL
jgi:hypothetical protein